ncbi:MAG: LuxR C-terminal-related transcriptional regulator [Nitrospira sp.]|nr:LuxR C-terminal-related transcriptional regulator [Nitrospira sp.]
MAQRKSHVALKVTPTQRVRRSSDCLTSRQHQILKLVAEGYTNREIAALLQISVRTVEVHRYNLMHRLEVRNVAQLLRCSLKLGLLPRRFVER